MPILIMTFASVFAAVAILCSLSFFFMDNFPSADLLTIDINDHRLSYVITQAGLPHSLTRGINHIPYTI